MVYRLYGYPQSGSVVIELALALGGIAHEVIQLDPAAGDLGTAAFLALNPRGQVPVLVMPDGTVVTELPAILTHLADAHPGCGLAPTPGTAARALHDRWLAFSHANLYEGVLRMFYADRYTTDPAGADAVRDAAEAYVMRHLALLDTAMGAGPFILGPQPMGVDCLICVILSWLDRRQVAACAPRLQAAADRLRADRRVAEVADRGL